MFRAESIEGYNKLNILDKELFTKFCKRFYEVWEYPEKHIPIKVEGKENYLKVMLSDGDWLHVMANGDWY
ncbi:hypothetical protein ACFHWD_18705 [Clostridium sp. MT-14]|jgi:desulfoferrodoxin (superoxide reductase-like protein)|uniref:hypothetical protein n=1 Tax=unclassified Clostridium TaxID=2614128 RepID=UPI001238F198|nr:hypothetical protein [Clostridium sp. HV4-5-A1G]KAA8668996.1 hypothetical protein F3O63_13780 [Clostridium sp. HV4-5-A1G]CAB1249719.1 conserved hypothetical protein [Clostridiaceae bacterium BL-3]